MTNIFPILLIISGMLLCISATYLYAASNIKNLKSFSFFLTANATYVLFFALELKSHSELDAKLFINLQYLGIVFIPSLLLITTKDLLNIRFLKDRLFNQILYITSFVFLFIIYTNQFHHLYIKNLNITIIEDISITSLHVGPLFHLMTVFHISSIILSSYLIIANYKKMPEHLKIQYIIIFACILIQLSALFIYLSGYSPYGIDLPAFALIITSFLVFYGVQKKYFLSILSLAEHNVFQNMKSPVIILSGDNKLIDYNLSAKILFNLDESKIGLNHIKIYHEYRELIDFVTASDSLQTILTHRNNDIYRVTVDYIQQSSNKKFAKYLVFTDMTKEHLMLNHLNIKARHDSLTSLLNRGSFEEFAEEFPKKIIAPTSIAFVMADIDFFKKVNDTYGHSLGDTILINFSQILKSAVRTDDIVCRYGGEEFLMVLVGITPEILASKLENLRATIENTIIHKDSADITITASFGACFTVIDKNDHRTFKDFVDLADKELYKVKKNGRNKVSIISKQ